jgi:hypothetical protein
VKQNQQQLRISGSCSKGKSRDLNEGPPEFGEKGRSVSIVSGYGLDDQVIDVRSPANTK